MSDSQITDWPGDKMLKPDTFRNYHSGHLNMEVR